MHSYRTTIATHPRRAWCRVGRAVAVSVALLGIAAIHVACGALVTSHPSATTRPTVLARSRFGNVIEDGVGYGGVRIGMTEEELLRAWGSTVGGHNAELAYSVRLFRLDTGEMVVVYLKSQKIASLQFTDARRSGETPLRTSQGLEMGEPVERVRAIYGDPERENEAYSYYVSRGIAFTRDSPRENAHDPRLVYGILVFEKAQSAPSSNITPR
jgi:hypothetical protein